MRRCVLLLFVLLTTLGWGQGAPNIAWSLPGPGDAPTPTFSPAGKWIALRSRDGLRVMDAKARKVVFQVEAPDESADPNPIAFSRDEKFIFHRKSRATGEVSKYEIATGTLIKSADLVANNANQVTLVAMKSVIASIERQNLTEDGKPVVGAVIRTFDIDTLAPIATTTLKHSNSSVPLRFAYGAPGSKQCFYFYDQEVDLTTGVATRTTAIKNGVELEAWTVGVDPNGGLIQQLAKPRGDGTYELQGFRRYRNAVSWERPQSAMNNFFEGPMQFAKLTDGRSVGLMGTGDRKRFYALDWATGTPLFSTNLGSTRGLNFSDGMSYPTGTSVAVRWNYALSFYDARTSLFPLGPDGTSEPSDLIDFPGGVRAARPDGENVAILGYWGHVGLFDLTGKKKWKVQSHTFRDISHPSHTKGNVIVLDGGLRVLNGSDGSVAATVYGTFTNVGWIGESKFFAQRSDGLLLVYNFTGTSASVAFTLTGFADGAVASPDGTYLGGIVDGYVTMVRVADRKMARSELPAILTSGKFFIRFDSGNNCYAPDFRSSGVLALYNFPSTGVQLVRSNLLTSNSYSPTYVAMDFGFDDVARVYTSPTSAGSEILMIQGVGIYGILPIRSASDMRYSHQDGNLYLVAGSIRDYRRDLLVLHPKPSVSVTAKGSSSLLLSGPVDFIFRLVSPAPAGGLRFSIVADEVLSLPSEVTIPAGGIWATFRRMVLTDVSTYLRIENRITAPAEEAGAVTVFNGLIYPSSAYPQFSLPSYGRPADRASYVIGGKTITGKVHLWGVPTPGSRFLLKSSNPAVISVPEGFEPDSDGVATISAAISRVQTLTKVKINAMINDRGLNEEGATIFVVPPFLKSLSFTKQPRRGGDPVDLRIALAQAPPTEGIDVKLQVKTPKGTTEFTRRVMSMVETISLETPVVSTEGKFTVTGTSEGSDPIVAETTLKPAELASFTLGVSSLKAGGSTEGTVTLDGPAGDATDLTITSSSPRATCRASLRVAQGVTTAKFDINTTAGPAVNVTITVKWRGKTLTKVLSITP